MQPLGVQAALSKFQVHAALTFAALQASDRCQSMVVALKLVWVHASAVQPLPAVH